jgi:hypothetical protein
VYCVDDLTSKWDPCVKPTKFEKRLIFGVFFFFFFPSWNRVGFKYPKTHKKKKKKKNQRELFFSFVPKRITHLSLIVNYLYDILSTYSIFPINNIVNIKLIKTKCSHEILFSSGEYRPLRPNHSKILSPFFLLLVLFSTFYISSQISNPWPE